jgi:hypothetical protein
MVDPGDRWEETHVSVVCIAIGQLARKGVRLHDILNLATPQTLV